MMTGILVGRDGVLEVLCLDECNVHQEANTTDQIHYPRSIQRIIDIIVENSAANDPQDISNDDNRVDVGSSMAILGLFTGQFLAVDCDLHLLIFISSNTRRNENTDHIDNHNEYPDQ